MNKDNLKFESLYNEIIDLIENSALTLTPEELKQAKDWIIDAGIKDPDTDETITMDVLDEVPSEQIINFIDNTFDGGIKGFKLASIPVNIKHNKLPVKENKEIVEEAGRCTGPTQKASSDRKGKKWMKCVKSGSGYKRVHWGQKGVRVTGKSGNTKRKKSFRARHKCSSAKPGTPRYQACKDW